MVILRRLRSTIHYWLRTQVLSECGSRFTHKTLVEAINVRHLHINYRMCVCEHDQLTC